MSSLDTDRHSIMSLDRKTLFRGVALTAALLFLSMFVYSPTDNSAMYLRQYIQRYVDVHKETCPSVLDYMLTGSWRTRNLTESERKEINAFLMNGLFFIDPSRGFQKPDLKCGNITYHNWMSRDPNSKWFRVLCDPDLDTPCCYKNTCRAKTIDECTCRDCFDLRSKIHAEYSTWIPNDKRCQVKNYTSAAACGLLNGSTLHFYGDSLVRQMFIAMVIILKGDYQTGGLRPDSPPAIKSSCQRMLVFPTKNCRSYLDYKPYLCNGTVKMEFIHSAHAANVPAMVNAARTLRGVKKSIILYGSGIWNLFDTRDTAMYALGVLNTVYPTRQHLNGNAWPRVLWSSFHYLGIWRQPLVRTVSNRNVRVFNQQIEALVSRYNVSSFKTVNITRGVRSVDGTHYGPGINFLKAQIYLNYIEELQRKGSWT